ncbi:dipicolinate synthase subunit A [Sporosarcina luteola]|nr:dipicolinate synthase subunit A [Sporosarcina luteola]
MKTIHEEKWLFIGSDRRMGICNKLFEELGVPSAHYDSNEYSDELGKLIVSFQPGHIVFPILEMKGHIPPELLSTETKLYVGVASEQWIATYESRGFPVEHYLHEERFIWENAILTAEGFLREFYQDANHCIKGRHFFVAGFGKVGKMTAKMIHSLGGEVTVVARSEAQLSEAVSLGYKIQSFQEDLANEHSILVNTIPAKWLYLHHNSALRVYDLASAPGCLKPDSFAEYYTIHLGLPGKHFPDDAAKVLAEALLRMK